MAGEQWVPNQIPHFISKAAANEGIEIENLTSKLEELVALSPISDVGIVMQIFIPKKTASKVMYIAFGGGFVNSNANSNLHRHLEEYEQYRESEDFKTQQPDQARILVGALHPDQVIIVRHTIIDQDEVRKFQQLAHEFWCEILD